MLLLVKLIDLNLSAKIKTRTATSNQNFKIQQMKKIFKKQKEEEKVNLNH